MKAWEALQILESLPADTEVTLTIGRKGGTPPSSLPKWVLDKDQWPARGTITCKSNYQNDVDLRH